MQRRTNIQISSLIAFFTIITIILQFTMYYYFASYLIVITASCLISIISCHVLLEQSGSYDACQVYSIQTLFISIVITVLTFFSKDHSFIQYTSTMLLITAINWFIPSIHCFIRNMFDNGVKIEGFRSFYRNNSTIFLLFYFGFLAYSLFDVNSFPWAYRIVTGHANFTPFWVVSTQIENYLYDLIPISDIITYLLSHIIIFIPYGFYCTLLLRRQSRLFRLASFLILPLILELLQYFIIPQRCDIDDLIYAFVGGIIGSLLYFLLNVLFRAISGKDFLSNGTEYRFSNGSYRF
jgi:hypothetical protein